MAAFVRRLGRELLVERRAVLAVQGNPGAEWRRYVRALRRRPVRILFPDGEEEKPLKASQATAAAAQQRGGSEKDLRRRSDTQPRAEDPSKAGLSRRPAAEELLDGLRFDRALAGDRRLGRAVSAARSRKYREQQGKVLLEGRRLICDALLAGAVPHTLFFSSVDQLRELPLDKLRRTSLVKVKPEDIQLWSDLVTPQGVIAIFQRPDSSRLNFPRDGLGHSVPLSIICDNVRDPGNLGTILRCAAAAGCHDVLLTKGCVDVWEPKVLRAAMGAHFRLPIFPSLQWEDVPRHLPAVVTVHLADNCSAVDERHGALKEAGLPRSSPGKAEEYGWVRSRPCSRSAPREKRPRDPESDCDSESDDDGLDISLPKVASQLYYESWAEKHTALVIGGETHGLSLEALHLAARTAGRRLFVPMVPGVDSLNSAMAASILLFEGRRQLLLSNQRCRSVPQLKPQ
ncbi:rRNA methyltransferase 3, mitochondrial [Arapaima gigas]